MKGKAGVTIPPRRQTPNIGKHMIILVTILINNNCSNPAPYMMYLYVHCTYPWRHVCVRMHIMPSFSVCSSEKIDKFARYSDFIIASMPYPGTSFPTCTLYTPCIVVLIRPPPSFCNNWECINVHVHACMYLCTVLTIPSP